MGLFESIFGSVNKKELKKIEPIIKKIESYDKSMQQLSDDELKHKTVEFKERLKNGETLDDIMPEAYAVVREASYRVLGMKQYRVQLIGGIVLHQGRIAEMKTGEGKTLVATLPAYLNALSGKGVHVVVTLLTELITNTVSIICVTTWLSTKKTRFREVLTLQSWTKLTLS